MREFVLNQAFNICFNMAGLIANCLQLGNEASFYKRIDIVGSINMNIVKTLINVYSVTSLASWHVFINLIFIQTWHPVVDVWCCVVWSVRINSIYSIFSGVFKIMWLVWSGLNGPGRVGRLSDTDLFPLLWRRRVNCPLQWMRTSVSAEM